MFGSNKKTSLTPEEYIDIVNVLEGYTTISDLLNGVFKKLGVAHSFYMHFPAVGAFDFTSSGIFYPYNIPDLITNYYSAHSKYDDDAVIVTTLEKGRPLWLSDSLKDELVTKIGFDRMVRKALAAIGDGLCCPLYGPDNRKGFIITCFGRDKSEFDPIMEHQVQSLAQIMHVRYCLMIKGLQKKVKLTSRESEVLELISYGKTNPEIAIILGISSRTVAVHASKVFMKLGTSDRVNAAMRAQTINIAL